jgi:hypothetical protein
VTTSSNGIIYTAWGDGVGPGCDVKVSYGFAYTTGSPNANLQKIFCGPEGSDKGKIASLIAIDNTLYASLNKQDKPWPNVNDSLLYSPNAGASWTESSWSWSGENDQKRFPYFVNYSPGNVGTPGGYVYMLGGQVGNTKDTFLARVPQTEILDRNKYEFFNGTVHLIAPPLTIQSLSSQITTPSQEMTTAGKLYTINI